MKKVSIVVPMFNEEEAAPKFFEAIDKVTSSLTTYDFEIVAINDGSKDKTLDYLKNELASRRNLVIVNLSRNWGQESAIRAGLLSCSGDCAIPIDADRQDPPELIPQLLEQWENGYEVVNAQRVSRKKDSAFKRSSAGIYYKILKKFSNKINIPENVGNYRLIDRKIIDIINDLPEKNRVLRIEIPYVGFKTCEVEFTREERKEGKSKYPLKAMINLAFDSLTSLSTKPLKYALYFGIGLFGLSIISLIVQFIIFVLTMASVLHLGTIELLIWLVINIVSILISILSCFVGLLGVYVGTIIDETKNRPNVIIDEVIRK